MSDEENDALELLAREMAEKVFKQIAEKGIPQSIAKLLSAGRKKDAVRICGSIEILQSELTAFILNAQTIGFVHDRVHLEIQPAHLKHTEEELEAFKSNGVGVFKTDAAKRFAQKAMRMFEERKMINGHIFVKGVEWHLFFFSIDDVASQAMRKSHWKEGDHIHYVSHLWNLKIEKVWSDLQNPPYSINSEHIRYKNK